ncbi:hypothetical protein [Shewanella algae]|uniref:hypothetical protein n=1 Tax=Shewanella algae TaxID=38313 RepID=UPI001F3A89F9|nr:hypothetical protein [Shewanella algae]MCE9781222.1 hypothetical protein [Shewanella algae]MCE9827313.1 hypothetical protein [Shewanella algae]
MKISTTIEKNFSATNKVKIDKFFQFVVIGEKVSGKQRNVDVFTAISFKAEGGQPVSVKVRHKYENYSNGVRKTKIKDRDVHDYYSNEKVLKQFWGKSTKCLSNPDFAKAFDLSCNECGAEIDDFYKRLVGNTPLFVEEDKKGIEKFFIIPCKSSSEGEGLFLLSPQDIVDEKFRNLASYGFWLHSRFSGEFKEENFMSFSHSIESDFDVSCPDFKVYYQVSKFHDVKNATYKVNDQKTEVIKVYSQQKTDYFNDWRALKIYESSLLRMMNGSSINEALSKSDIKKVEGDIELVDYNGNKRKELYLILATMFFSLLLALGMDATRLSTENFSKVFEIELYDFNSPASLTWLLTCLSLVVVVGNALFLSVRRWRLYVYLILSTPVFLMMMMSIHYPTIIVSSENTLKFIHIVTIIYMGFALFLLVGMAFSKLHSLATIKWGLNEKTSKCLFKAERLISWIWG